MFVCVRIDLKKNSAQNNKKSAKFTQTIPKWRPFQILKEQYALNDLFLWNLITSNAIR